MSNNILAWAMNTAMNSADLDAAADSHFNENDMSEDDLFGDEHESDDDMLQQNGLVRFVTNYVVEDNPTIPVMEGETDIIYPPVEEEERERSFQDLLQEEDEMELQQEHDFIIVGDDLIPAGFDTSAKIQILDMHSVIDFINLSASVPVGISFILEDDVVFLFLTDPI